MTPKQKKERATVLTTAYRDYEKGMDSYAFFKVNNHAVSEDLVQETFIKTWRYLVREGKIELMKPFLYHILNQLIIDEYRKKYRKHQTSSLDALLENGFQPMSTDRSEQATDLLDGKEALRLMQDLPPKYEKVMRMRYMRDLSLKEISLITGQSRNTVAVQAHRGLAKLRALYNRS